MGMVVHQILTVATWDSEAIMTAHKKASEMFRNSMDDMVNGEILSRIDLSRTGQHSFVVNGTGSKLGWDWQILHESKLERLCDFMATIGRNEDGSFPLSFVWVDFSHDLFNSDGVAGAVIRKCQSDYVTKETS